MTTKSEAVVRLMDMFAAYKKTVDDALGEAETALKDGRYADATNIMTVLSGRQAAASTAMRAVCIRSGLLETP